MPLKAFIGAPVAFQVGDIAGAERTICAIVFEARQLAADGGFVLYEFVCTDALSLLDQRVAELELALNEPYIEPELPSDGQKPQEVWQVAQTLERVVKDKKVDVRKEWNAQDVTIEPLASEEFSRLTDYYYPVWACGYNWLASNDTSADQLIQRINEAVAYYKRDSYWISTGKVIIVTHSMGGLLARRAAQKLSGATITSTGSDGDVGGPEKVDDSTEAEAKPQNSGSASGKSSSSVVGDAGPDTVLGVVHGVQPVGGAPVVYRRFRAGTEVNGTFNIEAALVAEIMGWSAADIVCVMGNSSGPLELLPTKHYAAGWLKFARYANGRKCDAMRCDARASGIQSVF